MNPTIENGIEYYFDIVQGTDDWYRIRHGLLTASTLKNVITPGKLTPSASAKTKLFYDEILSQRIDETIQPSYVSDDMMRGHEDEPYAIEQYEQEYGHEVRHCGFIINRELGYPLGYSPDGLVGKDGLVEVKSRSPKHQVRTILDHIIGRSKDTIPADNIMQAQGGLFSTKRKWMDFVSFCNGNQMATIRVEPMPLYQEAIEEAVHHFEKILKENMEKYLEAAKNDPRLTLTPRRKTEMVI